MKTTRSMAETGIGIVTEDRPSADGLLHATLERTERRTVEQVLEKAGGNVAEAAAMLGILRTSLYRIMKHYGITSPSRTRN